MDTVDANAVRGHSHKKFLHKNLSYESVFTQKFPDLWYNGQVGAGAFVCYSEVSFTRRFRHNMGVVYC